MFKSIPDSLLRGTVSVTSETELAAKLAKGKPLHVKLGVDPTTRDLHLGHTVCLRKMRAFQDLGHTGILIIGDFTAAIGDPSGRTETRKMLSREEILANAKTYQDQAFKVLDPGKTQVRFNSEWLNPFVSSGKLLEYLPRVTLARLTEREDFKKRISEGKPISMLEVCYPIFQGYDSVATQADVELGATDQTFNLLFGRDVQRDFGQEPQVTITAPILVGTDGVRKMSKSYDNYIAVLDEPGAMFGKTMSVSDETMWNWIEVLTSLDLSQLKTIHPMEAKKTLAREIVSSFYDAASADAAQEEFSRVHSEGELPADIPEFKLSKGRKIYLSQVLHQIGLLRSRKEAQRKIAEGAIRLEGQVVKEDIILDAEEPILLTFGRRGFCRIIPA